MPAAPPLVSQALGDGSVRHGKDHPDDHPRRWRRARSISRPSTRPCFTNRYDRGRSRRRRAVGSIDRLLCRMTWTISFPITCPGWTRCSGAPGGVTDGNIPRRCSIPFSGDRIGAGARSGRISIRVMALSATIIPAAPRRPSPIVAPSAGRRSRFAPQTDHGLRPGRLAESLAGAPRIIARAISPLPTPIDAEGGYAHNLWPKFTCPLSGSGVLIGSSLLLLLSLGLSDITFLRRSTTPPSARHPLRKGRPSRQPRRVRRREVDGPWTGGGGRRP